MSWSILGLPVVSYLDSGEYICKAKNFLGATEAFISLIITDSESTDDPTSSAKGTWNGKASGMEAAAYNDKLVARYVITTSTVPTLGAGAGTGDSVLLPDTAQDSNPQNLLVSPTTGQQEPERMVRSVRVIGDTDQSITLAWKAPMAKNTTVFSVLYAVFGERDMRRINVEPGKTKVTLYGLLPKTKYIVCVCVKGLIPRKEQCIIFSTDEVVSAGGTQKLINVVVISVACVIAVPLTLVVCCGALKRRCKKCFVRKPKDAQESYVTFESLSPGAKAKGVEGEYLTRHTPDESNRLLSARSSVDSEAIPKIEGQPNEYFCWQYLGWLSAHPGGSEWLFSDSAPALHATLAMLLSLTRSGRGCKRVDGAQALQKHVAHTTWGWLLCTQLKASLIMSSFSWTTFF